MSWWGVGAAAVGVLTNVIGGRQSSKASAEGVEAAASAQLEGTRLAIEESRRQFDTQMTLLMPAIQQQYNAMGMVDDLLGLGSTQAQQPSGQASGAPPGTSLTTQPDGTVRPGAGNATIPGGTTQPTNAAAAPGTQTFIGGSATNQQIDPDTFPRDGVATEEQIRQAFTQFNGREPTNYELEYYLGDRSTPGAPQRARLNELWRDIIEPGPRVIDTAWYDESGPQPYKGEVTTVKERKELAASQAANAAPPPGRTNQGAVINRDETGAFVDPNVDPTRIQDISTYGETVQNNLLAPTSLEEDVLMTHVNENQLAGDLSEDLMVNRANDVRLATADYRDDPRFGYAQDTFITGDEFEESPGYAWQVEEMERGFDRRNSAGGNYGGRAVKEAQRERQGLAAGDYYNWAGLRQDDLARADEALATWQDLGVLDVSRGDYALGQYQGRRNADVGRSDIAAQDYLRRRAGDATRLDNVAINDQSLATYDQQRQDQNYINYLNNVSRVAGYGGNPIGQAVGVSQQTSNQVTNAYGAQGANLSSIYSTQGNNQAGIVADQWGNTNNAIQGGIENYMFYDYLRNRDKAA